MYRYLFGLMALFFATTGTADTPPPTHEYTLKNGMKIIVREDHRAPVVVSQIWYRVGSSDEKRGITGISHVLEHMMFKGTRRTEPGEFSRIISRNGGRENAFTGQDYTAYFQQLEAGRLAISFELEADRMRNLTLDKKEFAKEIRVVMEERRLRTEDNPQALTYERFNATVWPDDAPYHNPIIGWMEDLEAMTVADLRDWYKKWYAPNNATLVVVGDIRPRAVYRLAKKHFGRIPPTALEKRKADSRPAPDGFLRTTVRAPAELPYLIMGYRVPTLRTADIEWEPYALEVLAGILDGGNSARLASRLIRGQHIAASASAGYDMTARHDSLLLFDATPAHRVSPRKLEKAIRKQLSLLAREPVTQTELNRVKAQVIAAKVYERDSIFYQAMLIGMLETTGLDWQLLEQYADRIRAVTAEQVMVVAEKYLTDKNLTIAELKPLPMNGKPAAAHGGHHGH